MLVIIKPAISETFCFKETAYMPWVVIGVVCVRTKSVFAEKIDLFSFRTIVLKTSVVVIINLTNRL